MSKSEGLYHSTAYVKTTELLHKARFWVYEWTIFYGVFTVLITLIFLFSQRNWLFSFISIVAGLTIVFSVLIIREIRKIRLYRELVDVIVAEIDEKAKKYFYEKDDDIESLKRFFRPASGEEKTSSKLKQGHELSPQWYFYPGPSYKYDFILECLKMADDEEKMELMRFYEQLKTAKRKK